MKVRNTNGYVTPKRQFNDGKFNKIVPFHLDRAENVYFVYKVFLNDFRIKNLDFQITELIELNINI